MTFFLYLAAGLALASGLLQLFGKGRLHGAVPLMALVELLVGMGVPILAWKTTLSPPLQAGLLAFVLGMVLYSAIIRTLRTRQRMKTRQETEGHRLVTFVRYLSGPGVADPEERDTNSDTPP